MHLQGSLLVILSIFLSLRSTLALELSGIFSDPDARVTSEGGISIPGGKKLERKGNWSIQRRNSYSIETQTQNGKFQSITELSIPEADTIERLKGIAKDIKKERRGLHLTFDENGKLNSVTSCAQIRIQGSMLGGSNNYQDHACATITKNLCEKLKPFFEKGAKASDLAACKRLHEQIRDLYLNEDDVKQTNANNTFLGQKIGFRPQIIDPTQKKEILIPYDTRELSNSQILCEKYADAFGQSREKAPEASPSTHSQ